MTGPRLVTTQVLERSFRFESGSDKAAVMCLHCGWRRSPRWRDYQRVFDLSNDHECPGVESYAAMRARLDAERAAELAAMRARQATDRTGGAL